MSVPTVSVLVPARGAVGFLEIALRSLRAQTRGDWEALLVGVDEPARRKLATARSTEPRVRVVDVEAGGEGGALAAAAAQAQGGFLCVLDGDDALDANALAALLGVFAAQPQAGMVYSRHLLVDAAGNPLGPGPLCELPYSPDALLLDFMTGPLQLMRTQAYRDAGGHSDAFPDAIDYDLCLRLSETCVIGHLPQPLYARRVHPQAQSVLRWSEQIEGRYAAFAAAVQRRGLDAKYEAALEIDSWHILQKHDPAAAAAE